MASSNYLVQGTTNKESNSTPRQTYLLWSRIVSKRFIGKGTVYNLTVHPGHTYFASGMLVHNCPFECGFCGGRFSPMLRRIRTRPAESVIAEMMHLYDVYGTNGIMLYDDELNVNGGVVDLMRKVAATE